MQDIEKILDRVRKLLRLSESNNPNEAATAFAKAQELIDKYKLSLLLLEEDDTSSSFNEEITEEVMNVMGKSYSSWGSRLSYIIANANDCRTYMTKTIMNQTRMAVLIIVGKPSNAALARYLFDHIKSEIERLSIRDCKGMGKTYANSYKLGAIDTIKQKLDKQREASINQLKEQCITTGVDMVHLNNALDKFGQSLKDVDEFLKSKNLQKSTLNSKIDLNAVMNGRKAAQEINVTKQSRLENKTTLALGSGD